MENVSILILIVVTFPLVYRTAYTILWFRIQSVFNFTSPSSIHFNNSSELLNELSIKQDAFIHKCYTEYSIPSKKLFNAARFIFSGTFACCIVAIEIILWEIKNAGKENHPTMIDMFIWPTLSSILSFELILIQPFCILIFLLGKFFNERLNTDKLIILTGIIIGFWILVLHSFNWGPFYYTSSILTKLAIIGATIMSILSGVVSISTPYYTFMFFWNYYHSKPLLITNGICSDVSLIWLNDTIIKERMKKYDNGIKQSIMVLKKLENNQIPSDNYSRDQLIKEIGWYQLELGKIEKRMKESRYVRTVKNLFQIGFFIYCIFKLILIFTNRIPLILSHLINYPEDYKYDYFSNSNGETISNDPLAVSLAHGLDFFLFHFNTQNELEYLIRQISLVLSISLFICSLSTVTTTISFLSTLLPSRFQIMTLSTMKYAQINKEFTSFKPNLYKNKEKPSIIKNLIVSELAGVYVLSTILMIRSNLPYDVSTRLDQLIGKKFTVPNIVIDVWCDKIYALSCILTLIGIKLVEMNLASLI